MCVPLSNLLKSKLSAPFVVHPCFGRLLQPIEPKPFINR